MDNEAAAHRLSDTMREQNFAGMAEVLAEDVVLNSPITASFKFEGRDNVVELLKLVRARFERPPEYDHVIGDGDVWIQVSRTRARRRDIHAVAMLRFGEPGKIEEITIFFRPMPALVAFAAAVAGPVVGRRGRVLGALLGLGARPLAAQAYYGDRLVGRVVGDSWRSTSSSTRSS